MAVLARARPTGRSARPGNQRRWPASAASRTAGGCAPRGLGAAAIARPGWPPPATARQRRRTAPAPAPPAEAGERPAAAAPPRQSPAWHGTAELPDARWRRPIAPPVQNAGPCGALLPRVARREHADIAADIGVPDVAVAIRRERVGPGMLPRQPETDDPAIAQPAEAAVAQHAEPHGAIGRHGQPGQADGPVANRKLLD